VLGDRGAVSDRAADGERAAEASLNFGLAPLRLAYASELATEFTVPVSETKDGVGDCVLEGVADCTWRELYVRESTLPRLGVQFMGSGVLRPVVGCAGVGFREWAGARGGRRSVGARGVDGVAVGGAALGFEEWVLGMDVCDGSGL